MINGQKEIWIKTGNNARTNKRIIAISNCGRIMRANGKIEFTHYRQPLSINGKCIRIHRVLAEYFIPKTENDIMLGRDVVDHISHAPENMNVNDIRNLRWCTVKENSNFTEAIINRAITKTTFRPLHETWNKGLSTSYTDFGKKFVEHFNILATDDYNLYRREKRIYVKTGKCSWE